MGSDGSEPSIDQAALIYTLLHLRYLSPYQTYLDAEFDPKYEVDRTGGETPDGCQYCAAGDIYTRLATDCIRF